MPAISIEALRAHSTWLHTNGAEGQALHVSNAELAEVDLTGRNLAKAKLPFADLIPTSREPILPGHFRPTLISPVRTLPIPGVLDNESLLHSPIHPSGIRCRPQRSGIK